VRSATRKLLKICSVERLGNSVRTVSAVVLGVGRLTNGREMYWKGQKIAVVAGFTYDPGNASVKFKNRSAVQESRDA
jgi:hypothetical protein